MFSQDRVQAISEPLVVEIGEDVIDSAALVQELLNSQTKVVDTVRGVTVAVRLPNLLNEQAHRDVQLVGRQLEQIGLEGLQPAIQLAGLLDLGILLEDPMLPGVDAIS